MNTDTLASIIESANETISVGSKEVGELLGNLELSDSVKKSELIRHLSNAQVELMFIRDELSAELKKRKQKKFYQFWK